LQAGKQDFYHNATLLLHLARRFQELFGSSPGKNPQAEKIIFYSNNVASKL
jgi:hypothetical protein